MIKKIGLLLMISLFLYACGKVGPLSLPEEKLNKSVISYPCDEECMNRLENEKKRQQSVIIQTD